MDGLNELWTKIRNYDYVSASDKYLQGVSVFAACVSVLIRVVFGMPVYAIMMVPTFIEIGKEYVKKEMNKSEKS